MVANFGLYLQITQGQPTKNYPRESWPIRRLLKRVTYLILGGIE
jgi:hypothetical protein